MTKRKRGRPRMRPRDVRTERVVVKCNPAELRELEQNANLLELPLGRYLRELGLGQLKVR